MAEKLYDGGTGGRERRTCPDGLMVRRLVVKVDPDVIPAWT
jgi:hypothetical protein